jgi:hypothetical protein
MSSKVPVRGVPAPIFRVNKPNVLVVAVCLSAYCTTPAADPSRIEIFTAMFWFTYTLPLEVRAIAW